MTAIAAAPIIGGDRDLHLLLPERPAAVLMVDSSDDSAESLRRAGHRVTLVRSEDTPWPGGHDVGVLLSPHRGTTPVEVLISRLDAAVKPEGALLVIDRPRWAWPDVLGRRDRITGRRWFHGALSARRVREAINRHRPIEAVCLMTPHDRRFRHLAPVEWRGRPCDRAAARLVLRELWAEAGLPLPALASVLAGLPLRAIIGSAPTLAWVAGDGAAARMKLAGLGDGPALAAFLGSPATSTCTVVIDPESSSPSVQAVSGDPDWSADALVEVAEALSAADVGDVTVASHHRLGAGVGIDWLRGHPPAAGDLGTVAAALGRIHRDTAGPLVAAGATTLAQGRTSLARVIEDARLCLPAGLDRLLDDLERTLTPTAWVHGDWGRRNVRLAEGRVGVFDLDLADEQGSAGFDVGWFILNEPDISRSVITAYESAAKREVTNVDLRLGLAGVLARYGPEAASAAWARVSDLGIEPRLPLRLVAGR